MINPTDLNMSYLKFDKSLMINLEQSLPKEMLRTNKSGAYHCTTIVGCNTRKQHGLLVIPIPEMDDKAHVLLSSLDETRRCIQPQRTQVYSRVQLRHGAYNDIPRRRSRAQQGEGVHLS